MILKCVAASSDHSCAFVQEKNFFLLDNKNTLYNSTAFPHPNTEDKLFWTSLSFPPSLPLSFHRTILCNSLLVWLDVSSNQKGLSSPSAKQGGKKQRKSIGLDLKMKIINARDEEKQRNIVQGEELVHSAISVTLSWGIKKGSGD